MEFNIPTEVKDKSTFPQIKKLDRQIICAAVLLGLSNQEAFRLFHPEYADMRGGLNDAGKQDSKHFWGYGKVKDYREQYEKELAEFLGRRGFAKAPDLEQNIGEGRKDKALKSLLNQAMSMVERGVDLDADTLKTVTEIFKKLNILKEEVEVQEKPRRYLPERCSSCLYKSFVECHVESGEIENACLRCKALKVAQEQGFRYDETNLLEPINTNL